MLWLYKLKAKIKAQNTPLTRKLYNFLINVRYFTFPSIGVIYVPLYYLHNVLIIFIRNFLRIVYWTPVFKTRLSAKAPQLYLFGGMPTILGPLKITLGKKCRLIGMGTLFVGRCKGEHIPVLRVSDNVDIGFGTFIAVGTEVIIGKNVRMAANVFLAGFPGHPLDPTKRALGESETDDQIGPIIIEDDVWLATNVVVLPNVRIGRGSVIATGSIVTKDIPSGVLAAGVPARVIKTIK